MSDREKTAAEMARELANEFPSDYPRFGRQVNAIAAAITEAEQRGAEQMRERCAEVAEWFSFTEPRIHPDVSWKYTNEAAKTGCHVASQEIAAKLRALTIPAPEEPTHG